MVLKAIIKLFQWKVFLTCAEFYRQLTILTDDAVNSLFQKKRKFILKLVEHGQFVRQTTNYEYKWKISRMRTQYPLQLTIFMPLVSNLIFDEEHVLHAFRGLPSKVKVRPVVVSLPLSSPLALCQRSPTQNLENRPNWFTPRPLCYFLRGPASPRGIRFRVIAFSQKE